MNIGDVNLEGIIPESLYERCPLADGAGRRGFFTGSTAEVTALYQVETDLWSYDTGDDYLHQLNGLRKFKGQLTCPQVINKLNKLSLESIESIFELYR